MLFSTTGGSTLLLYPGSLPSLCSLTPSPHLLPVCLPLYLVSLFLALSVAFRFKLQVAICPKCPHPPSAPSLSRTRPHVYIPLSIFGQLKVLVLCVFFPWKCIMWASPACVCAVSLVNDPPFSFLPRWHKSAWVHTLSLHSLTYLCQLGQDAGGGKKGGGGRGKAKANLWRWRRGFRLQGRSKLEGVTWERGNREWEAVGRTPGGCLHLKRKNVLCSSSCGGLRDWEDDSSGGKRDFN